ncbi:amidohydrolase [Nocardia sp. GAS34]|uniref:amidohydrolase n=1 Tax=unclassified Nocardia TaxID=2637762 RepID=UPI003D2546E0
MTVDVPGVPPHIAEGITERLSQVRSSILTLSHALHADPELGGQEERAVRRVRELLLAEGFTLDAEQPTASTALSARSGDGGLTAALCVEYDALPGIGHACGHNVNAAAAVGAALALAVVAEPLGLTVKVLGTPAEETTGGKVDLLEEGFFDDVSFAMMAHAAAVDAVGGTSLAMSQWDVLYRGRPAHAATAPFDGVNALDAITVAQTAIGLARQQLPPGVVVSLIAVEGGSATNVIPDRARLEIEVRAPDAATLRAVESRVHGCLAAGQCATGAELTVSRTGNAFADLRQDQFLSGAYRNAMRSRGRTVAVTTDAIASTDMGNVSHVVPVIHPLLGYDVHGAAHHTAAFAEHGASDSADRAVLDGAFGLAMAAAAAALDPIQRGRLTSNGGQVTPGRGRSRSAGR